MSGRLDPSLDAFHPLTARWFTGRFGQPTPVQREVWDHVAGGQHVLATAPTGSGKTLAAFLFALDRLGRSQQEGWGPGAVRVLYVSPLRALNNDIRRNLMEPLNELRETFAASGQSFSDIDVRVRSADTDSAERRRMLKRPPQILITTPESVNLLISSQAGRRIFGGLRTVILDEIHAVAGTRRGVFLMTAIERLTLLAGEFQRIALSATIEPLEDVARLIGGHRRIDGRYAPRPVRIVRPPQSKRIELSVEPLVHPPDGQKAIWPALADELRAAIDSAASTLIFVNNRRLCERLCHLINESAGQTLAWSHHGSLSREVRALVEQRLKNGELRAIVATSSLELGIDIGSVDQVLLVQCPRTINASLQRIGRAGHSVGAVSRARVWATHGGDLLDAAVFAPLICSAATQPVRPVRNALDVLAQVIVSMCGAQPWPADDLYAFVRTCDAYHELSRSAFDLVIDMLEGRFGDARMASLRPRLMRDGQGRLIARDGAMSLIYTSGGVIPDRGQFNIRVMGSRALLGTLDEEFVWERKPGEQFRMGMQSWRIEHITHNDVLVTPASRPAAMAPFWRGEVEDCGFDTARRVAEFLEQADARLDDPGLRPLLIEHHRLRPAAADDLIGYLRRQRAHSGAPLPHRHHVVVEHSAMPGFSTGANQIVIHACWGGAVLRPWAIAMAAAWQERFGSPMEIVNTDACLLIQAPGEITASELIDLVPPEQIPRLLRKRLENTGFFQALFRECAGRALLLPRQLNRRMPLWLNRLRARKLFAQVGRYRDFPIVAEVWRECLEDRFECGQLAALLEELRDGRIAVSEVRTDAPSPFAADIVWRSTNEYMYERDKPSQTLVSSLSEQTLRQVVRDAQLRPRLPRTVIDQLVQRLHRTLDGYAPADAAELIDLVNQRLAMPREQWDALAAAIRSQQPDAEAIIGSAFDVLVSLRFPGAAAHIVSTLQRVPRLLMTMEAATEECDMRDLDGRPLSPQRRQELDALLRSWRPPPEEADPAALLASAVASILSFHGPLEAGRLHDWLGGSMQRIESALAALVDEGRVVADVLREGSERLEYCDAENLERLLRILRLGQRPAFVARPLQELQLLLATIQGLAPRGHSTADLQARLERLFGYAAPAELWETAILPARMDPYLPQSLDGLMQESELMWLGHGPRRVLMAFASEVELFMPAPAGHSSLLPDPRGRYDFFAIERHTGMSTRRLTEELWKQTWAGAITNDSFAALRAGIENDFTPSELPVAPARRARAGFAAWKSTRPLAGNWRAVPRSTEEPDRLERIEADKERARQLLDRYGVLFRELLFRELPLLRWARLLPALRLMELAGEVFAGQFFEGIGGLQFASPEALRLLQSGLDSDALYWLSAADPASVCGLGLAGLKDMPPRQGSTLLIFRGARCVMISRRSGASLQINVPADDPLLRRCLDLLREQLMRAFLPLRRLEVRQINNVPALRSEYAAAFRDYGFAADYAGLTLYRQF